MRTWIATRPVTAYYLLALLFTWSYWIALITQGKHSGTGTAVSHLPGLLGPMLAAFAITAVVDGPSGLLALLKRMLNWGSSWYRSLLLALSPLAMGVVVFAALPLFGANIPPLRDFFLYPGLSGSLPWWVVLLLVLLINGYGEETGWRGFMMERLLQRYDRFHATLIIAAGWIIWHIPVFWINVSMTALVGPMLLGWVFGIACGAFVLAHVYLISGRSILTVALWHALYNMMVAPRAATGIPAAAVSTVVMLWGVVVAWRWWRDARSRRAPKGG
jgi:membrane protease YdiL (CAAX protease family)